MNGFGLPEGDADSCGCTYGHACDWHRAESERHRREERQAMEARGINPDASVEGLEEAQRAPCQPEGSELHTWSGRGLND